MTDREGDDWMMPVQTHWYARPHRSVRMYGTELVVVLFVLFSIGMVLTNATTNPYAHYLGYLFYFVAVLWPTVFYVKNVRWAHLIATQQDLELIESLTDPYWIVEMTLIRDGMFTSSDHGVLSFTNGAMYFYGRGCSFLIGSQDVQFLSSGSLSRNSPPFSNSYLSWVPKGRMKLKYAGASVIELGFTVLAVPGKGARKQTRELDEALKTFVMSKPTELERSYPPLWGFDPYTFKEKTVS